MSFEADDHDRDSRKVEDVADLNKRERLTAVHKQFHRAREAGVDAEKAMKQEGADPYKCRAEYRIELCALLRELCALGRSTEPDSLWWSANLGSVVTGVPAEIQDAIDAIARGARGFGRLREMPTPFQLTIVGLEQYMTTDWDELSASFQIEHGIRGEKFPREGPIVVSVEPSFAMSHRVLEYSRQFMREHEIDFGMDSGGLPTIANFDTSGEEPTGELTTGQSEGAPDL